MLWIQKPISSCKNKALCGDSSILVHFKKGIYKCVRVPDFGRDKRKNKAKCGKMPIFPELELVFLPVFPWHMKTFHLISFLTKFIPSNLETHQESSNSCIVGQIFNSSLIFYLLPILELSSKYYCTPYLVIIEVGLAKTLLLKLSYAYPKLWRENVWGRLAEPPLHGKRRVNPKRTKNVHLCLKGLTNSNFFCTSIKFFSLLQIIV